MRSRWSSVGGSLVLLAERPPTASTRTSISRCGRAANAGEEPTCVAVCGGCYSAVGGRKGAVLRTRSRGTHAEDRADYGRLPGWAGCGSWIQSHLQRGGELGGRISRLSDTAGGEVGFGRIRRRSPDLVTVSRLSRRLLLFGNKYVALSAPKIPQQQRISSHDAIDVGSVTTEFNTLFETITSIAEKESDRRTRRCPR